MFVKKKFGTVSWREVLGFYTGKLLDIPWPIRMINRRFLEYYKESTLSGAFRRRTGKEI